jgi:fibronectin type 3 domain-containing protein
LTINNGLTNGTTYDFYVAAVQNVCTDSTCNTISSSKETQSAIVSAMPQAKVLAVPSAVSASAGDQQVALSWTSVTDPAGGAVKYNVYCTTSTSSAYKLIGTASTNSFVHSGLTTGTTYYYVITSVSDQAGESAQSSAVSVTL